MRQHPAGKLGRGIGGHAEQNPLLAQAAHDLDNPVIGTWGANTLPVIMGLEQLLRLRFILPPSIKKQGQIALIPINGLGDFSWT